MTTVSDNKKKQLQKDSPLVYLVDDDDAIRDSLSLLLQSVGLEHAVFSSAAEFLEAYDRDQHSCLVTDIRMPGLSGLELQQRLNEERAYVPVIFITGHGDVPMAVNAMKSGAADFIQKPFRDQDLLDRIHKALARDNETRKWRAQEKVDSRAACIAHSARGRSDAARGQGAGQQGHRDGSRGQPAYRRAASRARDAQTQDALARRSRERGRQDQRNRQRAA